MHIVLLAAQSLDGRITRQTESGDAFTSDLDKAHFSSVMQDFDACVMGRVTYEQSRPRIRPERRPDLKRVVWTRSPDTYASETIPGALEFSSDDPAEITARLRAEGRRRCAILGGSQVNTAWLNAQLVDELHLTLESSVFGSGTPLAQGCEARNLRLLEASALAPGGPLVLRYSVIK
ncbi:MAG: dihydrofolate reductase family protein [Opitutaceae bacterium]|jgi:dihydrofolate reductase|nr:dihydrofolate reductase family protein [Opitutaceae bacterium]